MFSKIKIWGFLSGLGISEWQKNMGKVFYLNTYRA
jgi:hypothetical protein